MNLFEQIDPEVIRNMGVAALKETFGSIMSEIGLATHVDDQAVLALNAHNVWWEMTGRGVEFK